MSNYTAADVAEALRKARNSNAALKNFLKRELTSSDPAARFVKDLRVALTAKRPDPLVHLIEQGSAKFEKHLLAVLRYAYSEELAAIADPVVTKYADDFNKTYERSEDGIVVKDLTGFRRIFDEANALLDSGIAEQKLTPAGLMKTVLVAFVFEPDVMAEMERLMQAAN